MRPVLVTLLMCTSLPALAQELVFKPQIVKPVAGETLVIRGTFEPAGEVGRARVRFRTKGTTDYQPIDMSRDDENGKEIWETQIDGSLVKAPGVEFFVIVQTKAGKALVIYGTAKQPMVLPIAGGVQNEAAVENPLETAEERELRTGERATSGTLGSTTLRKTRPQAADLRVEDANATGKLTEEYAVFAAEDATAIASTYAQPARTAPAIITVFPRARIEQMGARNLLDILKVIPGFETSKSVLGFDEVSIRGIRSDPEILLLVDGHRVANVYDGRIPWNIPAAIIERVEVIRGPGSALYGTGAFLGVINVVTREKEYAEARTTMTLLKPSSYMLSGKTPWLPTYKSLEPFNPDNDVGAVGLIAPEVSGAAGGKYAGIKVYGSGDVHLSRGQRIPVAEDSFSTTGLERPPSVMQTDDRNAGAAFTAKADVGPALLKGGHGFARTFFWYEDRGPYFGVFDTLGPRSQLRWIVDTADVGYAQPFGDGGEASVRLYGDVHYVDNRLQLTPDGFSTVDRDGNGKREVWLQGVQARNVYLSNSGGAEARLLLPLLFRHRLNAGLVGEGNVIPSYRYSINRDENGVALRVLRRPPLDSLPQNQNRAWRVGGALYIQDEWRVLDRLFTTVGLRANFFSDVKWDPRTHITPRAALVFEPIDDLAFKLLYGAAFRAPTFEEKYDTTGLSYADFSPGVFIGNDKLEPEYIQTTEAGVDYGFSWLGVRYKLAANAFYSFIGNSIDRIDISGNREPIGNRGFREILGAESETRVEFAPGAYVYANVSWHRGWFVGADSTKRPDWTRPLTYVDAITSFPGDTNTTQVSYLTTVPQYRANLGANVELLEFLTLHGDVLLGAERRNNVRSTLESLRTWRIPAYALLNLNMRTRPILGWVGFESSLYNALDFDYRDDVARPDRIRELLPREGTTALIGIYGGH